MFSRVNAKAGVSRFPPPRPTDGSPRSNSLPAEAPSWRRKSSAISRSLPGPLLSLRASVSPLAVGENLLQGSPLPPIDGEAILGSHEHDLAGEPASILSR